MFLKYYLLSVLLIIQLLAFGQQSINQPIIRVARFYGDHDAAICYGFDDGLKNQADVALPLLDQYGFKGTFFIIPGIIPIDGKQGLSTKESINGNISWVKLKEMSAQGHEIANHSWSHKNMKTLTDFDLQQEIDKADQLILKQIGVFPITFAYPYNSFDDRVHKAVLKNHIAAREFQFGIGSHFTTRQGNAWADGLIKNYTWGITMIHGITKGFDTLSNPQVLDDHFKYVKSLESKIWVSTFAHISKYVTERDSSVLDVKYSNNQFTCKLSNHLDPQIYNQPITIVIEVKNVTSAQATEQGKAIPVKVTSDKLSIDVVPGAKEFYILWK